MPPPEPRPEQTQAPESAQSWGLGRRMLERAAPLFLSSEGGKWGSLCLAHPWHRSAAGRWDTGDALGLTSQAPAGNLFFFLKDF